MLLKSRLNDAVGAAEFLPKERLLLGVLGELFEALHGVDEHLVEGDALLDRTRTRLV